MHAAKEMVAYILYVDRGLSYRVIRRQQLNAGRMNTDFLRGLVVHCGQHLTKQEGFDRLAILSAIKYKTNK